MKSQPLVRDLNIYSKVKLGKQGRDYFGDFKSYQEYFGAFYYNAQADVASYLTGSPKFEVAIAIARSDCDRMSHNQGKCELYALMVPKGFSPNERKGSGLSQVAMRAYTKDYLLKARKGGYSAFSINALGSFGYAFNHGTAEEAADASQRSCENAGTEYLLTFNIANRKEIRKLGAEKCAIVDTFSP